jgi:hypothetical protein
VAAATAAIVYFGLGGNMQSPLHGASSQTMEIRIASSVTKKAWLEAAVVSFAETVSSHPIKVSVSLVLSGESTLQIVDGTLQPTVWSFGEAAWVDQLTQKWALKYPKPMTSAACAPSDHTPVGFAIWQPMAETQGWPDKLARKAQRIDLANDPEV